MPRTNIWVDGVNSAVAGWIELQANPDAIPINCDLGKSVHEDNHRFISDVERWYGKPILRIKSERYASIDEVFEQRQYLSGVAGAPCTGEMKFAPRMDYQLPSDMHLWGYTADKTDAKRFDRMLSTYPLLRQRAPLIELGMTKKDTHAFLAQHGVKRP
ncbi:hypothetical protein [Rhizorhabdus wittichii]|uniref:hypothetical protein n=1 Tax=Rhizorhabdus wittichii TaxID=160791 RepID=UPI000361F88A|nr:hypothetical protein [Rhizorhabdus wittichii]